MMALRAHVRGGPEVLVYESAPVPIPASDEVLVEVHAAAITFAELGWTETWQRDGHDRTPIVPSHEVSGVIVEVGDQVDDLQDGEEVYGLIRFDRDGAAAEYVTVPAADLARKPATVSHTVAAAVPLAALTAWQAWFDHAVLRPGESVLVHGGAGGVGAFAVQLASAAGAHVTATARGSDLSLVQRLGAEKVIDYEGAGWMTQGPIYDVVLDTVGGRTLHESFTVLRRGGRLITLQAPPSPERASVLRRAGDVLRGHPRPSTARVARRPCRLRRPPGADRRHLPARRRPRRLRECDEPAALTRQNRRRRTPLKSPLPPPPAPDTRTHLATTSGPARSILIRAAACSTG